MEMPRRLVVQRTGVYLLVAALGLTGFVGLYCGITGRPLWPVLGAWWIPLLIALVTTVLAAVRDQRREDEQERRRAGRET